MTTPVIPQVHRSSRVSQRRAHGARKAHGLTFACLLVSGFATSAPSLNAPVSGPGGHTPTAVAIELRTHVKVNEHQVRLGDIAFLTTRDLPTLRALMALPIGTAPRVGALVTLDRETVIRWVEARSGLSDIVHQGSDIRWSGADEVQIESAAQQLPAERIAETAEAALVRWLAERSVRAEVQVRSTPRDLPLPAGTPSLTVRPLPAQGAPSKRMHVWVDAWVDGRFVRSTAVSFEVTAWGPLNVATAPLARGAVLDPVLARAGFQRQEVELSALRSAVPSAGLARDDAPDAPAQRLRRPLREGEVLTAAHLEPAPAVTRGDWAQLLARSGNVAVQSRVEVLQDGRKGQVVRVKVPGAQGELLARVVGQGQLEAQP